MPELDRQALIEIYKKKEDVKFSRQGEILYYGDEHGEIVEEAKMDNPNDHGQLLPGFGEILVGGHSIRYHNAGYGPEREESVRLLTEMAKDIGDFEVIDMS